MRGEHVRRRYFRNFQESRARRISSSDNFIGQEKSRDTRARDALGLYRRAEIICNGLRRAANDCDALRPIATRCDQLRRAATDFDVLRQIWTNFQD